MSTEYSRAIQSTIVSTIVSYKYKAAIARLLDHICMHRYTYVAKYEKFRELFSQVCMGVNCGSLRRVRFYSLKQFWFLL
jgi:hypothetical protein